MMSDKKNRPTRRRVPLKQTTVLASLEAVFTDWLNSALAVRDWAQVEQAFFWYGQALERHE